MKAAQYIKDKGLKMVLSDLEIVEKHGFNSEFTPDFVKDLKRLVESLDYVSRWGGIERCKKLYFESPFKRDQHIKDLKRYITDYESIYGGGDETI